jgi:hypothetical protein
MPDLLIRDISIELKRQIERRAGESEVSLSEAAKNLIETGLKGSETPRRRALVPKCSSCCLRNSAATILNSRFQAKPANRQISRDPN